MNNIDTFYVSRIPKNIPSVYVFLERSRDGRWWRWVIRRCELCGGSHIHEGGPATADPTIMLGHRAAHCIDASPAGYMLWDANPDWTMRLIAEVR